MRSFYLFLSLLCILALVACGSEEELNSPVFSNIMVNGAVVSSTPYTNSSVIIAGNIDDFAATIVANSTASGEVAVPVDSSDGSWSFDFTALTEGANFISFTASDKRGNLNQMLLTVLHDTTAPLVTAVTQSVDPTPQLIVTFNEALLESSLATALFSVVNIDNTPEIGSLTGALTTLNVVTLTLDEALAAGSYRLTCPGVRDIATPDGNSVTADYSFPFTIDPIVE